MRHIRGDLPSSLTGHLCSCLSSSFHFCDKIPGKNSNGMRGEKKGRARKEGQKDGRKGLLKEEHSHGVGQPLMPHIAAPHVNHSENIFTDTQDRFVSMVILKLIK